RDAGRRPRPHAHAVLSGRERRRNDRRDRTLSPARHLEIVARHRARGDRQIPGHPGAGARARARPAREVRRCRARPFRRQPEMSRDMGLKEKGARSAARICAAMLCVALTTPARAGDAERPNGPGLVGTWDLASLYDEDADGEEAVTFGLAPEGRLVLDAS